MSNTPNTCYDAKHLKQFLHEQLDEADESSVLFHLDECPSCQRALEDVAADGSLWSNLREHFAERSEHDSVETKRPRREEIVAKVVDFLGPTDHPDMLGRLGPYEVCGVVGHGSTGLVLKAFEPRLNRFVAIKVLAPNFASSGSARVRFEREARAVAAVAHEHVIPIFAVDEFRDLPYLVMQYAGGGSLQQRIDREGPLQACEIVRVGMQVASGLAAAHAQGIVHRDVKPANVMLESGVDRAMVTDFGLARVVDETSMTRSGVITGTPQFMSPEQARGDFVDHRSDLFSLGSLMYAAGTGRPPFRSETVYGVIRRVCESPIRPLREVNPQIPDWLEAFVDKLCAKDREQRFSSAAEVRDLLARELSQMQSPANVPVPRREWLVTTKRDSFFARLTKSRVAILALVLTTVLLGVAASALLLPETRWSLSKDRGDGSNRSSLNTGSVGTLPDSDPSRPSLSTWNSAGLPVFESTITQALPVDAGGSLQLIAGKAHVEVLPSGCDQLDVRVIRKVAADDAAEAKRYFAMHQLRLTPNSQGMKVESLIEPSRLQDARRFGHFTIRVFVPDHYNVDVSTFAGDIRAKVVDGRMIANTNGGGITLGKISGDFNAKTDGGSIHVDSIRGHTSVETAEGELTMKQIHGDVFAKATSGDVTLDALFGSVQVVSASGNVDVHYANQPRRANQIRTIDGHIQVDIAESFAFDLDARTRDGQIIAPSLNSDRKAKRLAIATNGGGVPLTIESTKGSIQIMRHGVAATKHPSPPEQKYPKKKSGKLKPW